MKNGTFTVTEQHIKLLKAATLRWDDCEFGAPAIDCKRPYGNSDVCSDMAEILGIPNQPENHDEMRELHFYTLTALEIFLAVGKMEIGAYARKDKYDSCSWYKVDNE